MIFLFLLLCYSRDTKQQQLVPCFSIPQGGVWLIILFVFDFHIMADVSVTVCTVSLAPQNKNSSQSRPRVEWEKVAESDFIHNVALEMQSTDSFWIQ